MSICQASVDGGEATSGRMLSWQRGADSNKDNTGVDNATTKTRMDEQDSKDDDDKEHNNKGSVKV